ncbi:MAG: bifunctional transcriptional regulator/O-phospho-L-serine synthase SbnI [Anaerolineales bacterium]
MLPNLPTLHILPLDKLILHEDHDMQRTLPLVEKLRAQGILRNPPIVMPLPDGSGRFMVLDGANRFTSLKEMEFPHIVAQVVEPDNPHVTLQTWNHVVWGLRPRRLLDDLRTMPTLRLQKINIQKSFEPPETVPAQIRLPGGSVYLVHIPCQLKEKIAALHDLVNCYKERASLDRTSQTLVESFKNIYPNLTALIVFPRFDIQSVLTLAGQGLVLPAGITRFTVSPRVLHLNYPLHELSSGKPLEYKEAYLRRWVEERLKHKGVRYYAEATFLFDE